MADGGGAERSSDLAVSRTAIEAAVRVGLILLLAYWCFSIVQPFLVPIVWGLIIAIAVHPGYQRLHHALGGRSVVAATLVTVAALLVLIGPLGMLTRALIEDVSGAAQRLVGGALTLPAPPAWLVGLPVVGPRVEQFWHLATNNLAQALGEVAPQLQAVGVWLLGLVAGAGFGLLNFLVAIVIAGVMLAHAERGQHAADAIAVRLAGNRGPRLVELAERTVRNVARGVIGTALIQSTLVGLGLVAAGIPAAAFLTLIAFLLSIVQIGPAIVLLGAVIYVFSQSGALPGFLFLAWALVVGVSDNLLRPLLMSRGGDVPLPVILIGTIGGLLAHGLIGLFVGPVVFALGYRLFQAWVTGHEPADDRAAAPP